MIPSLYDTFKIWAKTGSVYIISDLHFGETMGKYADYSTEARLQIINNKVHKCDTLVVLGDIGNVEPLQQIKSKYKVLLLGNHDTSIEKYRPYFNEVYSGPLFIAEKILLSHEPIYGLETIALNIHGHVHDGVYFEDNHLNLAADVVDFEPKSLAEIIKQGYISKIISLHRQTIDRAIVRKQEEIQNG